MATTQRLALREHGPRSVRRLSPRECQDWLTSHGEGRLGYPTGRGPRSVVVRYAMADGNIVFRLPDYNDIVHYAPGEHVTLEVDGPKAPRGDFETVIVRGRAERAREQQEHVEEAAFDEQWPSGVSTTVIRLPMTDVEGFEHDPAVPSNAS
jgi:nitroimidazol reductase NimA-like FMN-containing flavoprotein (pyridoxamine 5'-phosphate oxidase superfamily)